MNKETAELMKLMQLLLGLFSFGIFIQVGCSGFEQKKPIIEILIDLSFVIVGYIILFFIIILIPIAINTAICFIDVLNMKLQKKWHENMVRDKNEIYKMYGYSDYNPDNTHYHHQINRGYTAYVH